MKRSALPSKCSEKSAGKRSSTRCHSHALLLRLLLVLFASQTSQSSFAGARDSRLKVRGSQPTRSSSGECSPRLESLRSLKRRSAFGSTLIARRRQQSKFKVKDREEEDEQKEGNWRRRRAANQRTGRVCALRPPSAFELVWLVVVRLRLHPLISRARLSLQNQQKSSRFILKCNLHERASHSELLWTLHPNS